MIITIHHQMYTVTTEAELLALLAWLHTGRVA